MRCGPPRAASSRLAFSSSASVRMRVALSANSAERVSMLDVIGNRVSPKAFLAAHKFWNANSNVNAASGWNKISLGDVLRNDYCFLTLFTEPMGSATYDNHQRRRV